MGLGSRQHFRQVSKQTESGDVRTTGCPIPPEDFRHAVLCRLHAGQYIFQTGFSGQSGLPNTILGHPYVEAPDVADIATGAKSVIFGDYRRGYMIVDRVALSVLRDPYSQASSGNVRYIARRRVGGEVVLAEAMRVLAHP